MSLDDFSLPFADELHMENRWVKLALAAILPWGEIEKKYAILFSVIGLPAKPRRPRPSFQTAGK